MSRDGSDVPKYPIGSVDNALRLLTLVVERRSLGVSEAAREIGVSPSTAHRLLAMLQYHGFLEQDAASKAHRVGPALTRLGLAALRDFDIRTRARSYLEQLVADVGETAHLVALHGRDVLFLDCVECSEPLRAASRIGQALPAHCTAGGKSILAAMHPEQVLTLFAEECLPPLTEGSITTRTELLRALDVVRELGYATNKRESEVELHAVAAAICDEQGTIHGAVTVAGPPARVTPDSMVSIGAAAVIAADAIGRALP